VSVITGPIIKISRILHAGYILECGQTKIAFDPIFENPFSVNCYAFPEIQFDLEAVHKLKFDAIFMSHYHDDHLSMESLNLLDRNTPIYIFSVFDDFIFLLKKLGFKKVHLVKLDLPISIGELTVTPLKALDEDVDSIYHIAADGINILNVVDSWIGPTTMEKLKKTSWDLILWPFQTMREIEVIAPSVAGPASLELPPEWTDQVQALQPKAIIPSSCQFRFEAWSWYNQAFFPISYAQFEKEIAALLPESKVLRLNPGESLELDNTGTHRAERLSWIKPIGDQNVDYNFNPNAIPQPISEIAKKFAPLTEIQKTEIHKFCQDAIIQRYKALAPIDDSYFSEPRTWELVTYDHHGRPTSYQYKISDGHIELTKGADITWKTEISEAKLFAVLTEGESLTSIYIRLTPPPEADPLEDPLIRCLYEGIIGGYQKAQLKRLGIDF
jgi:L-ascorbate metabolism protein UlaG (beta-lactamase superfamily)